MRCHCRPRAMFSPGRLGPVPFRPRRRVLAGRPVLGRRRPRPAGPAVWQLGNGDWRDLLDLLVFLSTGKRRMGVARLEDWRLIFQKRKRDAKEGHRSRTGFHILLYKTAPLPYSSTTTSKRYSSAAAPSFQRCYYCGTVPRWRKPQRSTIGVSSSVRSTPEEAIQRLWKLVLRKRRRRTQFFARVNYEDVTKTRSCLALTKGSDVIAVSRY